MAFSRFPNYQMINWLKTGDLFPLVQREFVWAGNDHIDSRFVSRCSVPSARGISVCHGMELCRIRARGIPKSKTCFMPKMCAAQIARPGGAFEIVEREIPQPATSGP